MEPASGRQFDSEAMPFIKVEVISAQSAEPGRRGFRGTEYRLDGALDDDVIELEFQAGFKQWTSVAQLREDLGRARQVEPAAISIPAAIPRQRATGRGVADWVLKGLKLLRLDPIDPAADLAVAAAVGNFETKLVAAPGLYRLSSELAPVARAKTVEKSRPLLVFLHGTASNTQGSFGGLVPSALTQIEQQYGKRIFGFEHQTLSVSPIRNALQLARELPDRARLHLVSHSRGGLVGELLCLGKIARSALEPFIKAGREEEVEELRSLATLLEKKRFEIERFVRVACPSRGTLLASNRLDTYLSVILSLVGRIPVLSESVLYAFLKATTIEVARRRTRPDELPGLEAMMPTSLLVNFLNRPDVSSAADLAVIAGDIEGEGLLGSLKVFATDLFYREDHDLVVNTGAMYGGIKRKNAPHFLLDRGSDVNHFNYFSNERTRSQMLSWLSRDDNSAFGELTQRSLELTPPRARRSAKPSPVVFLLPGFMATHLTTEAGKTWLDLGAIGRGDLVRLEYSPPDKVNTDGVIATAYDRLIEFLSGTFDVRIFPFDWRKSVVESGSQLAQQVEAELSAHQRPLCLLGHSTGGLVARAMISEREDLWQGIRKRGGRLVMLGTPNGGTWAVPRILLGIDQLVRLLALADFARAPSEIAAIMRGFPGMLEQLPIDCLSDDWWRKVLSSGRFEGFEAPESRALSRARKVRERLDSRIDSAGMYFVAGRAPLTPCGIDEATGETLFSDEGDGRAIESTARNGLPSWRIDCFHGDLANHPPLFPSLLELLETGKASRLHEIAGGARSRTLRVPSDADRQPLLFPTEEDLATAAMGANVASGEIEGTRVNFLEISVVHGDLRYASYPITVGHYQGDTIVSAEAAIDRQLGGRLSALHVAGLYPGPVGSAEVIISSGASPPGALVVGLGDIGEITPEKLRRGVRAATLRHALLIAEGDVTGSSGAFRSAAFSSLILGTVGGNSLSIETSVAAIIEGALHANRALKAQGLWERVRIDKIEFVELHEDLAIAAIRAAHNLERVPPHELEEGERIDVTPPYLVAREGGLFHRPANQYSTGWWRRIQITSVGDEEKGEAGFNFLTLTDRARAEDRLESMQRRLVDRLIASAIESPVFEAELCVTLYELLIPNLMKDQSSVEANVALVLDSASAQYPWELLAERAYGDIQPFVLRQGVIRQFKVSNFRQNPQSANLKNVFVVGDTESGLAELPGAQQEAQTVAGVLGDAGFTLTGPLLRADPLTVISELFARDYRILHLAGHGVYDPSKPDESGMLLGEGIFLTSRELVKLRVVPDLVFLNCCHLGKMDTGDRLRVERPDRLAASVAEELIKMGVKALVVAGWAVDDRAASKFAEVFYSAMVQGVSFGEAVLRARQRTAEEHGSVNTWGAYQCYGNPAFTITNEPSTAEVSRAYYSRREYIDRIRSLARYATTCGPDGAGPLRDELEALVKVMPAHWLDGEMLSAIGEAWGELHEFERATSYYRQALQAPGAEATLKSAEQLANLLVRQAQALERDEGEKATRRINRLYREAFQKLEWLLRLGATTERLSLVGSLSKRLALVTSGTRRSRHLRDAADFYNSAAQHSGDSLDPLSVLSYASCRWLGGTGASRRPESSSSKELLSLIHNVESRPIARDSSFWERVTATDALLLHRLIEGKLEESWQEVSKGYISVIKRGATPREVASILDELEFLEAVIGKSRRTADAKRALLKIRDAIRAKEASTKGPTAPRG